MATKAKKRIVISGREFPLSKTTREIQKDFVISNKDFPFRKTKGLPEMEELYKTLVEFYNVVNPFGNSSLNLKGIKQYPADMKIVFEPENLLILEHKFVHTRFIQHENGWDYQSCFPFQKNGQKGEVSISYFFSNGNDDRDPLDQIVCLNHYLGNYSESFIDLKISLKTGLAWKTYYKEQATRVTDEQIETMIAYLKISIKKIRQNIVRYMVSDN